MASIEQAKDALEVQREQAAQITERALTAINDVVALGSHTLAFIGVFATIIALIGGVAIFVAARDMAKRIATKRVDAYIKTAEGVVFLKQAISEEVRAQIEQKLVVFVQPTQSVVSAQSGFPQAPTSTGEPS